TTLIDSRRNAILMTSRIVALSSMKYTVGTRSEETIDASLMAAPIRIFPAELGCWEDGVQPLTLQHSRAPAHRPLEASYRRLPAHLRRVHAWRRASDQSVTATRCVELPLLRRQIYKRPCRRPRRT